MNWSEQYCRKNWEEWRLSLFTGVLHLICVALSVTFFLLVSVGHLHVLWGWCLKKDVIKIILFS